MRRRSTHGQRPGKGSVERHDVCIRRVIRPCIGRVYRGVSAAQAESGGRWRTGEEFEAALDLRVCLDADDDLPAGPALVFFVFSCIMKSATLEETGDDGRTERTNDATGDACTTRIEVAKYPR